MTDIRKDTSGNLRTLLVALVQTEWLRHAEFLHKSVQGWGTDNQLLVDILFTKEADEILKIREAYSTLYPGTDLVGCKPLRYGKRMYFTADPKLHRLYPLRDSPHLPRPMLCERLHIPMYICSYRCRHLRRLPEDPQLCTAM